MMGFGFHGPPMGICNQMNSSADIQTDFDTGAQAQNQTAGQHITCC